VTLQKTAERVAAQLQEAGFPAEAYHAGMEAEQRTAIQERWMASDRGVVVATIAFGMGIDKADVRYVYHYNLPKSLESYSQEIGRAGRDGVPSTVEMFACLDDVSTLENFAYGDTPTEAGLRGLLSELLTPDKEFSLNLYDLSNRHDLRPLVLKTTLTYLELLGVLHQGTPYYASYELRPLRSVSDIIGRYRGEPARLVANLFAQAKQGRTWYALAPDAASEALGQERGRIVRALEVLEEKGWIELRVSDVRQRYRCLLPHADADPLARELARRFVQREEQEITRLQQVLSLATHDGCQTNALNAYFGESRPAPCGHCSYCLTGKPQQMAPARPLSPLPDGLDVEGLQGVRAIHPQALGEPRQAARFLCGLTSPALTRTRLIRHALFGVWEQRPFREVLDWLSTRSA
jgi:ATP-dependent DNA helicase RecQ